MQSLFQIPHGVALELWHGLVLAIIGGSVGWIKLYLNRKKPASEIEEAGARSLLTRAEARKREIETDAAFSEMVVGLTTAMAEAQLHIAEQGKRHAEQLRHREEQEEAARDRAHNAIDEVNRCVKHIKFIEAVLIKKEIPFEPFAVKTYKEIIREE